MTVCEFITAILGVAAESTQTILKVQVAFICIYIFFFSTTWGPAAWVCVGEIFPIPIRSRGVALSTASNWLWNCIIAVITPFMVDTDRGVSHRILMTSGARLISLRRTSAPRYSSSGARCASCA